MRPGVSLGPDRNDRLSACPVARIFTEVPPMSMTKTRLTRGRRRATALRDDFRCRIAVRLRLPANDDLTLARFMFAVVVIQVS